MGLHYCTDCNETGDEFHFDNLTRCPQCGDGTDIIEISECCGMDLRICPKCKEHV